MADTSPPTRTALGAATVNRATYVDVAEIPTTGDPQWVPLMGITEWTPHYSTQTTQDTSDFDGEGYTDSDVTALGWGGEGKIVRKTKAQDRTAYDEGQELCRQHARQIGVNAPLLVRMYEYEAGGPREEAVTGRAIVGADWDGGGMDAVKTVSLTITGKGKPTSTDHPFPNE